MPTKVHSILMIDDDKEDFEIVNDIVRQIDPAVSVAFIEQCKDLEQYRNQEFDFVMLDINMPLHDGFEWLKGIKHNRHELPVIMYTNSSNPAHVAKAYGEGATLFFIKPDSYNLLLKGIEKLLQLDWSDPSSIKQMHIQNGKYKTFQAN